MVSLFTYVRVRLPLHDAVTVRRIRANCVEVTHIDSQRLT